VKNGEKKAALERRELSRQAAGDGKHTAIGKEAFLGKGAEKREARI